MSEYDCIGVTSEYLETLKNKIEELEQQLTELKESQKQKQIIKLCERLDKAEQQNKQMIKALKKATNYMRIQRPFMNYVDDIELYEDNTRLIESVTGKKIEYDKYKTGGE